MKRYLFVITLLIVGLWCTGVYRNQHSTTSNNDVATVRRDQPNTIIGQIGMGYFNFEVVDTFAARAQGLSGRDSLPATDAMLFVFDRAATQCIWMKDMKFPIDILWVDDADTVAYMMKQVDPSTYPKSFCPDIAAKYVVEMTAGTADKNQIRLGDRLQVAL